MSRQPEVDPSAAGPQGNDEPCILVFARLMLGLVALAVLLAT